MKSSRYEVERLEIKYQPYIITYDDQELVQLVYDTRKAAQARVDEINNEDRLDRLGVEGKQNKKVGIREVKRVSQESIFRGSLEKFAKKLGTEEKAPTSQSARRHIAASSYGTSQRSYWDEASQSLRVRPGTSQKD